MAARCARRGPSPAGEGKITTGKLPLRMARSPRWPPGPSIPAGCGRMAPSPAGGSTTTGEPAPGPGVIGAGDYHSCGVRTDATLACWGLNADGEASPPAGTFLAVSAGGFHSCGLRANGTLACWGQNGNGEASPPAGTFTTISVGY